MIFSLARIGKEELAMPESVTIENRFKSVANIMAGFDGHNEIETLMIPTAT